MDKNRRKFLKIILVGGGALIVGKVLDPIFSKSMNNPLTKADPPAQTSRSEFKIVENKKILSVYDRHGEEIFQIDKEA